MRYLFSQAPKTAEEFADKTESPSTLPERVNPKGAVRNKPVTPAFQKRPKKRGALSSYDENS